MTCNGDLARKRQRQEALLKELEYFDDAFWHNEEGGERRVQFLIGLVSALFAALAALGTATVPQGGVDAQWQGGFGRLCGLSFTAAGLLGMTVFLRIVKRDCVTEEYKAIARHVRLQIGLEDPFLGVDQVNSPGSPLSSGSWKRLTRGLGMGRRRKPRAGGLVQIVAVLNTALLLLAAGLFAVGTDDYLKLCSAVLVVSVVIWQVQMCGTRKRYREDLDNAYGALRQQSSTPTGERGGQAVE